MAFDRPDEIDAIDAASDASLSDSDAIVPLSIHPVIGEDLELGLTIDVEKGVSLRLSLPPQQLEGLRNAIRRLEAYSRVLGPHRALNHICGLRF
jgi:hypothetical protein